MSTELIESSATNPCLDLPESTLSPLRGIPTDRGIEYYRAGLLVLLGMARERRRLGRDAAAHLVVRHEKSVYDYVSSNGDEDTQPALNESRQAIIDRLAQRPDWNRLLMSPEKARALIDETIADAGGNADADEASKHWLLEALIQTPQMSAEIDRLRHKLEGVEYANTLQDSLAKELCKRLGVPETGVSRADLRMAVDSAIGSRMSAELQRDEMSAFALGLLDHIRAMPDGRLPSDLEMIHHSLCASPRTLASEETARGYVERWSTATVQARIDSLTDNAKKMENELRGILTAHAHRELGGAVGFCAEVSAMVAGARRAFLGWWGAQTDKTKGRTIGLVLLTLVIGWMFASASLGR